MVLPEKASSARLKAAGRLAMGGGAFFGGRVGIGGGAGISAQLTASCESLGSGAAPVTVDDAQLPCSSTRSRRRAIALQQHTRWSRCATGAIVRGAPCLANRGDERAAVVDHECLIWLALRPTVWPGQSMAHHPPRDGQILCHCREALGGLPACALGTIRVSAGQQAAGGARCAGVCHCQ